MNFKPITYVPVTLRPTLNKMRQNQQRCKAEAIQYAICASQKGYDVVEKQCQKEFDLYKVCLNGSI